MEIIGALALLACGAVLGAAVAWQIYLNQAGYQQAQLTQQLSLEREYLRLVLAASAALPSRPVLPEPSDDVEPAEQGGNGLADGVSGAAGEETDEAGTELEG